jgi:hypothetical protein
MTKLLLKLTVGFLLITLAFCSKKSDQQQNQNPPPPSQPVDYTLTPATTLVSTRLMIYPVANDQATNPYYVLLNTTPIIYNNFYKAFNTPGTVLIDKYTSVIAAGPSLTASRRGFTPYKTFTASGAMKTYLNVKLLPLSNWVGYVAFDYGSNTIQLPGNGQLILPPYSFGSHPGPVTFHVYADFLSPSIADYAVTLPCYPMADENGKRWFLNSYGVYLLIPEASDYSNYDIKFNPDVNIVLRMPVPANEPSAPDSIAVWNLNDKNLWVPNGFAKRNGNYYEKKVTKKGYWNFAIPVNGVYVNFRLSTNNGYGVPNIRYVIRNGSMEVAEGRTDANGDGLVFVPTNKELTIDVFNDYPAASNIKIQNLPFGNFNQTSSTSVKLPARKDIFTIQGNVFDCNGKPVNIGHVGITTKFTNDELLFPITNGKFSAAQWIGGFGYIPATIKIYNSLGDSIASHPFVVNSPRGPVHHYNANFYTCNNTTQLYCNYRLDSTDYSITGSVDAASPELYSKPDGAFQTRINMVQNGKGLRLNSNDGLAVPGYSISITNPEVNGSGVTMDFSTGENYLYFYRDDLNRGGFKEGWFYFKYKDSAGILHTITGNFRVKVM